MGYLLPRTKGLKQPQIVLVRRGSRNLPSWQLVVRHPWGKKKTSVKYIEDLGYYQAYTDERGKRYIRVKVERIKYWIAHGCQISSGAYRILYIAGIVPPQPMRRAITLGECRLARYLHEQLKEQGHLKGLPDGISPLKTAVMPGKMPHDEWKKSVLKYQYVGKLYSTKANNNATPTNTWRPRAWKTTMCYINRPLTPYQRTPDRRS
eukprot:124050_1